MDKLWNVHILKDLTTMRKSKFEQFNHMDRSNKVEERNKITQVIHLVCDFININFRNRPSKPLECCLPCVIFDLSNSYIGFYIMYCSNAIYLYYLS